MEEKKSKREEKNSAKKRSITTKSNVAGAIKFTHVNARPTISICVLPRISMCEGHATTRRGGMGREEETC